MILSFRTKGGDGYKSNGCAANLAERELQSNLPPSIHSFLTMLFLQTLAIGSMLAMNVNAFHPLISRQNVNPGPVSGATFIHDPTVVKTPGGSYIAAFTANGVGLKQ